MHVYGVCEPYFASVATRRSLIEVVGLLSPKYSDGNKPYVLRKDGVRKRIQNAANQGAKAISA